MSEEKIEAGTYNTHRFWRFIHGDSGAVVHIRTIDGFPSEIHITEEDGNKVRIGQSGVDALLLMIMGARKDGHMELPRRNLPKVDWQSYDTDGENWKGIPDMEEGIPKPEEEE